MNKTAFFLAVWFCAFLFSRDGKENAVAREGTLTKTSSSGLSTKNIDKQLESSDEMNKTDKNSLYFAINFAKAADLQASITPFLSGNGKIQADSRTNTLIITDITSKMETFAGLIESLDTKTAQVNNEYVTLHVKPMVTSIVSTGPPPIVDTRTASTQILIKDGDTFAIGGLIREDDLVTINKVPVFGDIPLIGSLFQNKTVSKTKRDLIVLITPHIIR
ncbi:MAG: hypothetical protein A2231_07460 [Candidatus Firestonebacteria bacterium RIFOXYA2_FULL_40_8]|nr:MAG: hypothetical protein A2231_07460 [Candidatus Firestonebacteria bacterium RIFOXYA2_FULL_40_8]